MIVDRNSWHAKVYRWWYSKKYDFPFEKTRSNLCPYMRAVMFWAPLRALFLNSIKLFTVCGQYVYLNWFTTPTLLIPLPFLLGYVSYKMKLIIFLIYGVMAFLSTFVGAAVAADRFSESGKAQVMIATITKVGFIQLLGEYLRSAHDRVCPEVDIL